MGKKPRIVKPSSRHSQHVTLFRAVSIPYLPQDTFHFSQRCTSSSSCHTVALDRNVVGFARIPPTHSRVHLQHFFSTLRRTLLLYALFLLGFLLPFS